MDITQIFIWFGEEDGVWKEGGNDYPLTLDGECNFKFFQEVDVLVLDSLRHIQRGEESVDFSNTYNRSELCKMLGALANKLETYMYSQFSYY